MYLLSFYVPESDLERVKSALFEAGAGAIGNYSHCLWQTKGEGQFLPHPGSQPYIGEINHLERVSEFKVEIVCAEALLQAAINALKKAHPYETTVYSVTRLEFLK